jgi:hypothetical protein
MPLQHRNELGASLKEPTLRQDPIRRFIVLRASQFVQSPNDGHRGAGVDRRIPQAKWNERWALERDYSI